MHTYLSILLQIDWSDLRYTVDDLGRTVYSFPIHIRVLLAITLIFLLIILILLAVVLSSRIYKTGRAIKREQLRQKYQKVFRVLLFEERTAGANISEFFDQADLRDNFHRETVMDEIIHLHENFTGETAERLEEIFMRLNFHFDSIKKLRNKRWYIVAKGMRELALMNVRQALPEVSQFLNNNNEILRMEARIAIMKLSEEDPLSFLSREMAPLTGWDAANIHSMLTKMPEKMIPDFRQWIDSPNPDVVLFCIQMTGTFRQQDSIPKLLELLKSESERIRLTTVKALRSLSAAAAEKPLIEMYDREDASMKIEILKALEVIGSMHSAPFLENIVRRPPEDYALSIQAVRALLTMGNSGIGIVDRLFGQADPEIQLIINHAKDKRL